MSAPLSLWRMARYENGFAFRSEKFTTGGLPVVRIRQLVDESAGSDYYDGIVPTRHLLKDGDLIFSWSGSLAVRTWNRGPAWLNQHLFKVTPETGVYHAWLRWILEASIPRFEGMMHGSAMTHLNLDMLKQVKYQVPSLEKQGCIADFLDAETNRMDRLMAAQGRVLRTLAERRMAGVISAVAGGRHSERRRATVPWLQEIPKSWQEARVGLLARMGSGHTPSRSHPEWWVDCTIPWITTGEVKQVRDDRIEELHETREKISTLGLANSAAELHPKGTVFLCRTASAGYSGVMGLEMATSQDFVTWSCGPRLDPYYLLWCLRAMRADLLGRLAMGSTHKTIYVPDLQMLRIPLPPLGDQNEAVETIRDKNAKVDALVDKVRRQIELLKERRRALITAAVTGQFDVSTAGGRGVTEGIAS